jgi:hypothetical protein
MTVPGMGAQARTDSHPGMGAAEVQVVLIAVIQHLSPIIATSVMSADRPPWVIESADSTFAPWRTAVDGLYALFHARKRSGSDSVYQYLRLGPMSVRGDSLFSWFEQGTSRRCKGDWAPTGGTWNIVSVRKQGFWGPPALLYQTVSDSFC